MLIEQHQSRVLAHIVKVLLVIGEILAVEDLLARQIEVVEEDIFVGEEGLVAHSLYEGHAVTKLQQCTGNIRGR